MSDDERTIVAIYATNNLVGLLLDGLEQWRTPAPIPWEVQDAVIGANEKIIASPKNPVKNIGGVSVYDAKGTRLTGEVFAESIQPQPPVTFQQNLYLGTSTNLYGLTLTGQSRFEISDTNFSDAVPVGAVMTYEGNIYFALQRTLVAIAPSGAVLWSVGKGDYFDQPLVIPNGQIALSGRGIKLLNADGTTDQVVLTNIAFERISFLEDGSFYAFTSNLIPPREGLARYSREGNEIAFWPMSTASDYVVGADGTLFILVSDIESRPQLLRAIRSTIKPGGSAWPAQFLTRKGWQSRLRLPVSLSVAKNANDLIVQVNGEDGESYDLSTSQDLSTWTRFHTVTNGSATPISANGNKLFLRAGAQ